jgi:hypothetical protein
MTTRAKRARMIAGIRRHLDRLDAQDDALAAEA